LNATGKASKMEIDKAVNKQKAKDAKKPGATPVRKQTKADAGSRPGSAKSNAGSATGLKITFKPAELNKTTDPLVAKQVHDHVAKQ
jgi:hypothetical protein